MNGGPAASGAAPGASRVPAFIWRRAQRAQTTRPAAAFFFGAGHDPGPPRQRPAELPLMACTQGASGRTQTVPSTSRTFYSTRFTITKDSLDDICNEETCGCSHRTMMQA